MSDYPEIAARFASDTAGHQMTVLHDTGLYRHLRFSRPRPESSTYWFDLITWPGCLTIRGDIGESYTFNRLPDMFQFFRSDQQWGINQSYWAEKLDAGRESVKEYNEDLFRQLVCELFVDAVRYGDAPAGLGKAVREEILNSEFLADEDEARGVLDQFEYKGFRFRDTWELSFHDYEWTFLWACNAIRWGIGQYDKVRKYGLQQLAVGDLVASAVAEERCLKAPAGCGQPLVGADGSARVFWDEEEAARYAKEWQTSGLCPDCQDAAPAVTS